MIPPLPHTNTFGIPRLSFGSPSYNGLILPLSPFIIFALSLQIQHSLRFSKSSLSRHLSSSGSIIQYHVYCMVAQDQGPIVHKSGETVLVQAVLTKLIFHVFTVRNRHRSFSFFSCSLALCLLLYKCTCGIETPTHVTYYLIPAEMDLIGRRCLVLVNTGFGVSRSCLAVSWNTHSRLANAPLYILRPRRPQLLTSCRCHDAPAYTMSRCVRR